MIELHTLTQSLHSAHCTLTHSNELWPTALHCGFSVNCTVTQLLNAKMHSPTSLSQNWTPDMIAPANSWSRTGLTGWVERVNNCHNCAQILSQLCTIINIILMMSAMVRLRQTDSLEVQNAKCTIHDISNFITLCDTILDIAKCNCTTSGLDWITLCESAHFVWCCMELDNKVGRDGVQCSLTSDAPISESPCCIFRLGYICCRKGLYLDIRQHLF